MDKKYHFDKDSILGLFILAFLLAEVRLFYMVPLPYKFTGPASTKVLAALVSVITFGCYIVMYRRIDFGKFGGWIAALFAILALSGLSSYISYGYKLTSVIWTNLTFPVLLMYFPAMEYIKSEERLEYLIKIEEIILIILAVIVLIQWVAFNNDREALFMQLEDMISDVYYTQPSQKLRLYSIFEGTSRVFILIATYRCIKREFKKCLLDFITMILLLAAVVFVDQSRTYLIALITGIAVMAVITMIENKRPLCIREKIVYSTGVILGVVGLINKTKSVYASVQDSAGSLTARVGAVKYYMTVIWDHLIFGLGITIPDKTSELYSYFKGADGNSNYDDIGIFGVFFSLGVAGLIWYIAITVYLIRLVIKTRKNLALSVAVLIVFLMAYPLMSYIDNPRVMALLLTMMVVEINYNWDRLSVS